MVDIELRDKWYCFFNEEHVNKNTHMGSGDQKSDLYYEYIYFYAVETTDCRSSWVLLKISIIIFQITICSSLCLIIRTSRCKPVIVKLRLCIVNASFRWRRFWWQRKWLRWFLLDVETCARDHQSQIGRGIRRQRVRKIVSDAVQTGGDLQRTSSDASVVGESQGMCSSLSPQHYCMNTYTDASFKNPFLHAQCCARAACAVALGLSVSEVAGIQSNLMSSDGCSSPICTHYE